MIRCERPADTGLTDRLRRIRERMDEAAAKSGRSGDEIELLAVTKTVPPERVNEALRAGICRIGENRVQEYLEKRDSYEIACENVHFIGHLQTNKVKYIIDKVGMIQSVSSLALAEEIDRRAAALGRPMEILLEVNIAAEETKSGFFEQELIAAASAVTEMEYLRLRGLMCIPPKDQSGSYFARMEDLFYKLRSERLPEAEITWLSMGMSGDYEEAIAHGANLVRLGTALFGDRK